MIGFYAAIKIFLLSQERETICFCSLISFIVGKSKRPKLLAEYITFSMIKINRQSDLLSKFAERVVLTSKEDYEPVIKGIEKINDEM